MTTYLRTARMTLRRATAADEDDLLALSGDPRVMRYLGPTRTRPEVREHITRWLENYRRTDGRFGHWPAIETATGAFLGWFVFRPPREDHEPGTIELGYRLHVAAWGRGLATEGARALVGNGFAELGVPLVTAATMAINTGSRRVLEKSGLRHVGSRPFGGSDHPVAGAEHGDVVYRLGRAEWMDGGTMAACPPRSSTD